MSDEAAPSTKKPAYKLTDDDKALFKELVTAGPDRLDRVAAALTKPVNINARKNVREYPKVTPLHVAAVIGDVEAGVALGKLLLANGAKVDSRNEDKCTPLHYAVGENHEAFVDLLLDAGADLEAVSNGGYTPLLDALRGRNFAMVEKLLARGANPRAVSEHGGNALHIAANAFEETGTAKLARVLELGLDVNQPGPFGRTALHEAASCAHLAAVELLLGRGADLAAVDENGATVVHLAASCVVPGSPVEVIRLLVGRGAAVDARDGKGNTPLLLACGTIKLEVVEALVALGADVRAVNELGETALHLRAGAGNTEDALIRYLVAQGVDINQRDRPGRTPLHHAKYPLVVAVLKKHGAKA